MNVEEQVRLFQDFLEKYYKALLAENIRKGIHFLNVDFSLLVKAQPDLAELLLEDPEDLIKAFELAVEQFDFAEDLNKFRIRLNKLPDSQSINIGAIRSKNLNKLFKIKGIIRQKSDVRPLITSAKFECPQCGNILISRTISEVKITGIKNGECVKCAHSIPGVW